MWHIVSLLEVLDDVVELTFESSALLHSLANAGIELRECHRSTPEGELTAEQAMGRTRRCLNNAKVSTRTSRRRSWPRRRSRRRIRPRRPEGSPRSALLPFLSSVLTRGQVPDPEVPVPLHFVTFVEHQGQLIELDGYGHEGPISHGPMTGDLLRVRPLPSDAAPERSCPSQAVVPVVKKMMDDSGSWAFNLMSLAPVSS